mgnify:CR=1 FL=1
MKKPKNNLDEMQEQKLLHIEQRSFWLAFWMLGAATLLQLLFCRDSQAILGECIVLAVVGVYLVASCLKNGLWDRQMRPTPKTNFRISLLTGLAMGAVWGIVSWNNYHKLLGSVATAVFMLVFVGLACFAALNIASEVYKRKKKELEQDGSDDEA